VVHFWGFLGVEGDSGRDDTQHDNDEEEYSHHSTFYDDLSRNMIA
jgi:hypothetical protein